MKIKDRDVSLGQNIIAASDSCLFFGGGFVCLNFMAEQLMLCPHYQVTQSGNCHLTFP